jgi:hypothetical protein
MTRLAGIGLVLTGKLRSELKTVLPARKKVRKHPMFFIDNLKKIGK